MTTLKTAARETNAVLGVFFVVVVCLFVLSCFVLFFAFMFFFFFNSNI